jgi:hypothetical protein
VKSGPAQICILLFLAAVLALPSASPGLHQVPEGWGTLEETPITIRYPEGLESTAAQILDKAGGFLEGSGLVLGLEFSGQYSIVLADSEEQFVKLQPGRIPAPEWAGALTYPALGTVLLKTPGVMKVSGSPYWSLLQHEMVHLVLGEAELARGVNFPRWFSEGLATYISGEMHLSRLLSLGWAQATGRAPALAELEMNFPADPARAEAAYARSYLFIKYISRRFGDDAVAKLVASSLRTGTIERGVMDAFDVPFSEVLDGFSQYSRIKATWIPAITSTASLWMMITILFLVAYMRKKVLGYRQLARWEEEEAFLYDEDVGVERENVEEYGEEYGDENGEDPRDNGDKKPTLH